MLSVNREIETEASVRSIGMFDLLRKREIRAALVVGIGLQVYYSSCIVCMLYSYTLKLGNFGGFIKLALMWYFLCITSYDSIHKVCLT
jgi:hypothetical protein